MSFKLATIETAKGPRAAILVGDKAIDIAAATGRGCHRTGLLGLVGHSVTGGQWHETAARAIAQATTTHQWPR